MYQGLHLLTVRDFQKGGELLIDALSTFTASELMDYDAFVTVTVISCMVWMERTDIKKKVRLLRRRDSLALHALIRRSSYLLPGHQLARDPTGVPHSARPREPGYLALQLRLRSLLPVPWLVVVPPSSHPVTRRD